MNKLIPVFAAFSMLLSSTITAAEVTLTILYDNGHSLSNNLFTGADKAEIATLSPNGFSPAECRVFHVAGPDGKACLIDTGRGGAKLPAEMKAAGISPESIGAILLTHTHGDHTGGLLADDGATAVFTNATIYITSPELEFWRNSRSDNFAAVNKAYKFSFIIPDKKTPVFMPGIVAIDAPGHTPGHVLFLLDTPARPTLVAGDLLHSEMQLKNPDINAVFDNDKPAAAAMRKQIFTRVATEGWKFTTTHLPADFYDLPILSPEK